MKLPRILLGLMLIGTASLTFSAPAEPEGALPAGENPADQLSPFRENWILGELRSIRSDMMQYRTSVRRCSSASA